MKKYILFIIVCFAVLQVNAQNDDPFGETNFDTTSIDSSFYEEEPAEEPQRPDPNYIRPYVRFAVPFDTITELITYMGIVPFKPYTYPNDIREPGDIDSLYARAKKYLLKNYGKNPDAKKAKDNIFDKDVLITDYKPDGEIGKIIISPTIPFYIYPNKYRKELNGTLTFTIDIRVKEDKYKYKFINFVHHTVDRNGKTSDVYMEYYMQTKSGARSNDILLVAIDKLVKQIIKDLGKVMPDPIIADEDDF